MITSPSGSGSTVDIYFMDYNYIYVFESQRSYGISRHSVEPKTFKGTDSPIVTYDEETLPIQASDDIKSYIESILPASWLAAMGGLPSTLYMYPIRDIT